MTPMSRVTPIPYDPRKTGFLFPFCILSLALFLQGCGSSPLIENSATIGSAQNSATGIPISLVDGNAYWAEKLSELRANRVFFDAGKARSEYPVLEKLSTGEEISLGCSQSNGAIAQPDSNLECNGLFLTNEFRKGDGSKVKQALVLDNKTGSARNGLVSVKLSTKAEKVISSGIDYTPQGKYAVLSPKRNTVGFSNSGDKDFNNFELDFSVYTSLEFFDGSGNLVGSYDWGDLARLGYPVATVIYSEGGETKVETVIEVPVPANQKVALDPTYAA